jgi:hypothetical protein
VKVLAADACTAAGWVCTSESNQVSLQAEVCRPAKRLLVLALKEGSFHMAMYHCSTTEVHTIMMDVDDLLDPMSQFQRLGDMFDVEVQAHPSQPY